LGTNLHLEQLRHDYDAVFLALGLGTSRRLGLTGEDAPGLMAAVDYISELRQAEDLSKLPVPAQCVVIGAGNTAIDMAVQIARLGAQQVTLVYRRGAEHMSATLHEQEIAKANQVRIVTWAQPQQVLFDYAGNVAGMRFAKTQEVEGKLKTTGDTVDIEAQAIFKAIGQSFNQASLSDAVAQDVKREKDKIWVDEHYRTSLPKVYAGGDCIAPGQDLTVQAVQHGKLAALAINDDLKAKV